MKVTFLLIWTAAAASAQNSDVGLLLGISGPSSQVVTGTQVSVSGSVGASGQINYARQLKEYNAGRLYLELPLLIGARTSGTVAGVPRLSSSTSRNPDSSPTEKRWLVGIRASSAAAVHTSPKDASHTKARASESPRM